MISMTMAWQPLVAIGLRLKPLFGVGAMGSFAEQIEDSRGGGRQSLIQWEKIRSMQGDLCLTPR